MHGALESLKILDFSTLLPGPYASLVLADLGAEVLKISAPGKPDIVADYPPFIEGTELSANQAWLGRNKKNMFLDLKKPKSLEIVKKLILEYDIVLEQFRPGVMERLGLGYEDLKKVNPSLIYCSLTGYGHSGPMKMRAGHDINYLARSGNMAYSGKKETGPVLTNMQIADVAAGSMNAVIGILSAVHYRHMTGKGQFVDISMFDGLIPFHAMEGTAFLADGREPQREGQRLNGGCLYDFYETKDGKYLSVGSLEPKFWEAFCTAIGKTEYIEKTVWPEDAETVKSDVKRILKEKTLSEWLKIFEKTDACVEPVLSVKEALLEDAHIKARNMVIDVKVPGEKEKTVKQLGCAIKLSECPVHYEEAGSPLGHHTEEILNHLGYTGEEIRRMKDQGIW